MVDVPLNEIAVNNKQVEQLVMNQNEFKFSSNGIELQAYCWESPKTKAVIVLVHGMGEHALRFEDSVIKHLLEANYAVLALDLYGHGKSKGKRGHCPNYNSLLEAVDVLVDKAQEFYLSQPIYLYGHSLGANIALSYVLNHSSKIDGIVATSPFLKLAFNPPKWKLSLGKMMHLLMPSITLSSDLEVNAISRDSQEVKRYVDDALIHDKISPMYFLPVLEAGEQLLLKANTIKTPGLLLHGTADRLTDHKATKRFAENADNLELKLFDGGYHELHHDLCKEEFIKTVINWLNKQ